MLKILAFLLSAVFAQRTFSVGLDETAYTFGRKNERSKTFEARLVTKT